MGTIGKNESAGYDSVPGELRAQNQWVCWRPMKRGDKIAKVPVDPSTGWEINHLDADNWRTFEDAVGSLSGGFADGVGLVFSEGDGLCGFDIDECRNPQEDSIQLWAWELIRRFDTYTEVSPSGTGVKGYLRGRLPGGGGPKVVEGHTVELYDRGRFFAVTGRHLEGTPTALAERQAVIDELLPERSQKHKGADSLPEKLGPG